MVVTCENCSARYKLDDNRISGRGAKITCPRCRHVFVVYKDRPAAQAEGRVAVGGGIASPAVPSAPKPPAPEAPSAGGAGDSEAEADALDFRKVGIQAWKVKVKIGLVYDFSDYRTLARYIAEGRVTASDKLSYDGSTWTEISQIPDLAAHFVSVYHRLEAEQAAAEEEEDYEDDEPTNIMGMSGASFDDSSSKAVSLTSFSSSAAPRILPSGGSPASGSDLASAMSAALDAESGGAPAAPKAPVGPRFIDPFEKRKNTGRPQKPRPPGGSTSGGRPRPRPRTSGKGTTDTGGGGSRNGLLLALGVVILGGIGVWWYLGQQGTGPGPTVQANPPPLSAGQGEDSRDEIREKIEQDILSGTEVEDLADDDPPEDEDAWGGDDDDPPKLIPVGPRGPVRPTSKSRNSIPSSSGPTARDHAAAGDSAMKRGDYRGAVSSYQKAVGMEPSNSVYNGRLGAAMVRNGQGDAAMDPLMKAASGGYSPAFVYLGDVAASRGDRAGAIGYYQSYLATNPRDAATVQAKIDRLSG